MIHRLVRFFVHAAVSAIVFASSGFATGDDLVERGAYLAKVGNCEGCHTARGGAPFAGGKPMATPFGTFYASNLTPDRDSGLGAWSSEDFWRAMHEGVSRGGRLLYPAFPYPNYTRVTRQDSDAIFAFLKTITPRKQANRPHDLRLPFDQPWLLRLWRALFFRAEPFVPDPSRTARWNRGAYLARGLGHCDACHAPRNWLGAVTRQDLEFDGGTIPEQKWYAPSLHDPAQAGLSGWTRAEVVNLLRTGRSTRATTSGPMAEIVARSMQHWKDEDLDALSEFLVTLPTSTRPKPRFDNPDEQDPTWLRGKTLYGEHCKNCHGDQGQGRPDAFPALDDNRAVVMHPPANVLRIVLVGGYAPATKFDSRPHGMPPFGQTLGDADVAAVVTYIRSAWSNRATPVSAAEANRVRGYGSD
jgi:mono/diheme cytochrome c family protein